MAWMSHDETVVDSDGFKIFTSFSHSVTLSSLRRSMDNINVVNLWVLESPFQMIIKHD